MENIEKLVTKTYLDNITYLQQSHHSLYTKVSALETALNKGFHQEKYSLEYKDNYFDIKEISSDKYLYSSNSLSQAKEIAKNVNYNKVDNIFETFFTKEISSDDLKYHEVQNVETSSLHGLAPLINYSNNVAQQNSTSMINIKKFIFLGIGLGLHIEEIHKKITGKEYLIIEDDLEQFRLSLFTLNYAKIAQNTKLYFWVFDDPNYSQIVTDFFNNSFVDNQYIKFYHLHNHKDIKLKTIQSIIASQEHLLFNYSNYLNQSLQPLEYFKNKCPFLNFSIKWNDNIFTNKPTILVAAGPSLKKNIKWLRKHQDKFIIVAVSAALLSLENENIIPDIVTHFDGFKDSLAHFDKLRSTEFLQESLFVFSSSVSKAHINKINNEYLYFYENLTQYKKESGSINGICVGSYTFGLLLHMGATQLYLLGLDLALDQKSGQTHTDDHVNSKKLNLSKHNEVENTFSLLNSTISTKGNFTSMVMTTSLFKRSIKEIDMASEQKSTEQFIYNLSDGAFFKGTLPLQISDIETSVWPTIEKQSLRGSIQQLLTEHSKQELTEKEYESIKNSVIHAKKLKQAIIDYQAKKVTSNTNEYKQRLTALLNSLFREQTYTLSIIYIYYGRYILPYIFDILNTKELKNPKQHMRTINKMLIPILLEIEKIYEEKLKKLIKE